MQDHRPSTPEQLDKVIRVLNMARLFGVCILAAMGPFLYYMDIVPSDMVIWVCTGFGILAILDWYAIGRIIRTVEMGKEQ